MVDGSNVCESTWRFDSRSQLISQWHTGELDVAQLEAEPQHTKHHQTLQKCKQRAFNAHFQRSSSLRWNCWTHFFSLWYSFPKMMPSLWQTLWRRSCSWEPRIPSNLDWNWQILAWKDMKRLMTYMAGMICFACQPEWSAYIWRNGIGEVVGWRVWSGCRPTSPCSSVV